MLIQYGFNGYLSKVSNLSKPAEEWVAGGMPITKMMNMERRNGKDKPVIRKALTELDGAPFKYFEAHRDQWLLRLHSYSQVLSSTTDQLLYVISQQEHLHLKKAKRSN